MGDTMEKLKKELEELEIQYASYTVCKPEIYSRIVGYYRSYSQFNDGKLSEVKLRVNFILQGE